MVGSAPWLWKKTRRSNKPGRTRRMLIDEALMFCQCRKSLSRSSTFSLSLSFPLSVSLIFIPKPEKLGSAPSLVSSPLHPHQQHLASDYLISPSSNPIFSTSSLYSSPSWFLLLPQPHYCALLSSLFLFKSSFCIFLLFISEDTMPVVLPPLTSFIPPSRPQPPPPGGAAGAEGAAHRPTGGAGDH